MARVTLVMPSDLETLDERVAQAVVAAMVGAAENTVAQAKTDPTLPVVTGGARRSLAATPVRAVGDRLRVSVVAVGEAAQRTEVLDKGRAAGAPGPSWRHLAFAPGARGAKSSNFAAMRGGWLWRRCREQVEAKATELAALYRAAHPNQRKAKKHRTSVSSREYWLAKAVVVLASSKASAIHAMGITARGFVSRQVQFMHGRLRLHLRAQFVRLGITTRSGQ
jgi:hypothetical protein